MNKYSINLFVAEFEEKMSISRTSALICTKNGNEVFAIEMDGSISGSANEAIEICKVISEFTNNVSENTISQMTIGVLRAIKKLQEVAE